MFGSASGGWWLFFEIDPRWNSNGVTKYCGGFQMPEECKVKIEQLTKELGEPPEDLEYGYMKD